jgi:hypothetical protein
MGIKGHAEPAPGAAISLTYDEFFDAVVRRSGRSISRSSVSRKRPGADAHATPRAWRPVSLSQVPCAGFTESGDRAQRRASAIVAE